MSSHEKQTHVWDHVYRARIGDQPYPWEIRSQVALGPGHKFFLPLTEEVMANPSFARPVWKPRLSPNFARAEVEEVDGETLVLRSL